MKIVELKFHFSDMDTYFCGVCEKFLFCDVPGKDYVMCQNCERWYCIECSDDIGISFEKLVSDHRRFLNIKTFSDTITTWDYTVDVCPKCRNKV